MKLKIICVAYERPIAMRGLIDCFLLQTNPNWELTIIHDGKASQNVWNTVNLYNDNRIVFSETEQRNQQFGHPNRKMMIEKLIESNVDFVLITNDDNYYVPVFVEYMSGMISPDVGMVYCDSVHSHFQYIHHKTCVMVDHIDIGSFIVRIDIAKRIGFTGTTFNADGVYAMQCANLCKVHGLRVIYIPKPLFVHN